MFFQCGLPDDARVPQLQGLGHPPNFFNCSSGAAAVN
jgi:hypothetical protein